MKRLVLLLIVIVVVVAAAFLGLPGDPGKQARPVTAEPPQQSEAQARQEARQAAIEEERDRRLEAMKAEYKKLERARRDLRLRLQEVSYYMARAELPDEQAADMRDEIGAANRMLVNPPLLGAFRGPDDIVQELEKIERINRQLDGFEEIIRRHGGYGNQ